MDLQAVSELIRMMEQSSLTALEVEQGGLRVRLENGLDKQPSATTPLPPPELRALPNEPKTIEPPPAVEEAPPAAAQDQPQGDKKVTSPMVGTFHELKKKVAVGAKLKKGDPICIIEAMKVMNEIIMEEDGEITYIAAIEGEMVEFGQVLYLFD